MRTCRNKKISYHNYFDSSLPFWLGLVFFLIYLLKCSNFVLNWTMSVDSLVRAWWLKLYSMLEVLVSIFCYLTCIFEFYLSRGSACLVDEALFRLGFSHSDSLLQKLELRCSVVSCFADTSIWWRVDYEFANFITVIRLNIKAGQYTFIILLKNTAGGYWLLSVIQLLRTIVILKWCEASWNLKIYARYDWW